MRMEIQLQKSYRSFILPFVFQTGTAGKKIMFRSIMHTSWPYKTLFKLTHLPTLKDVKKGDVDFSKKVF